MHTSSSSLNVKYEFLFSLWVSFSAIKYLSKVVISSLPNNEEHFPVHRYHIISIPYCFWLVLSLKRYPSRTKVSILSINSLPLYSCPWSFIFIKLLSSFKGTHPCINKFPLETKYILPFENKNDTCFCSFSLFLNDDTNLSITISSSFVNLYGFFGSIVGKLVSFSLYIFPFKFIVPSS